MFRFKEQFQQVISADYVFVLSHVVRILYNPGLYMHLSLFLPMVSDMEPIFVKYVVIIKHDWRHRAIVTCISQFDWFDKF